MAVPYHLQTTESLKGLIKSQGGDFHTDPADTTYPSYSGTFISAMRPPPNYIPFVISLYNVETGEARYPLTLMVNPTDIQYGHTHAVQNAYTRRSWVTTYWGQQLQTLTVSGSSAGFYYNPNQVMNTVRGLRIRNGGLTNYNRRNSLEFANLLALVSFFKRNGSYFLTDNADQTLWNDGTSRVINVMDFVMISYDGADHVGSFNTFTLDDNANMPYRINYNFEFVVAGFRGDFLDGHLRKDENDKIGSVQVSIQGDDMELTKTARMDEQELNDYFKLPSISYSVENEDAVGSPSYSLANPNTDSSGSTYSVGLKFVLRAEGGFVDNPNDPGGATNYGITQAVYDNYRRALGLPTQSVRNIGTNEVNSIYQQQYWNNNLCASLPPKLSVIYFDACVNTGGPQATRDLQRALNVSVDGKIGPITIDAAQNTDVSDTISAYFVTRRSFYINLAANKPKYSEFLRGWLNRLDNLEKYVNNMRV